MSVLSQRVLYAAAVLALLSLTVIVGGGNVYLKAPGGWEYGANAEADTCWSIVTKAYEQGKDSCG